jgi:hypothetical protein
MAQQAPHAHHRLATPSCLSVSWVIAFVADSTLLLPPSRHRMPFPPFFTPYLRERETLRRLSPPCLPPAACPCPLWPCAPARPVAARKCAGARLQRKSSALLRLLCAGSALRCAHCRFFRTTSACGNCHSPLYAIGCFSRPFLVAVPLCLAPLELCCTSPVVDHLATTSVWASRCCPVPHQFQSLLGRWPPYIHTEHAVASFAML